MTKTISPVDCEVLLLAAGFGKRLRPMTDSTPKPMLEVGGKPLIEWNLMLLQSSSFKRVFINLHHHGGQIRQFVGDGARWGLAVEYSEEPLLLDTGGGIKNIESRMTSSRLVVVNSDTLVGKDFSFQALLAEHAKGARATLMVRKDPEASRFGALRVDAEGRIVALLDAEAPGTEPGRQTLVMFGGIHVIERGVIEAMPAAGSVFSITHDTYRTLVRNGEILRSYQYPGYWNDVGTPERLVRASKEFTGGD